jgi:hypothetical protein
LAQKVLRGETKGYRDHPQLNRFGKHPHPLRALARYLISVWEEGQRRGYHFNKEKIGDGTVPLEKIPVTTGQLRYELHWLCAKLRWRDPARCRELLSIQEIACHPMFDVVEGAIEEWEKDKGGHFA